MLSMHAVGNHIVYVDACIMRNTCSCCQISNKVAEWQSAWAPMVADCLGMLSTLFSAFEAGKAEDIITVIAEWPSNASNDWYAQKASLLSFTGHSPFLWRRYCHIHLIAHSPPE